MLKTFFKPDQNMQVLKFRFRKNWLGRIILQVEEFEDCWRDAKVKDFPDVDILRQEGGDITAKDE